LFNAMAGIKGIHIPYKGLPPATADTIAGNVTMSWDSITASGPFIRAKRIRALGIGSAKRSALMPEIPTISESGLKGFELGSWYAIFAPAGTAAQIIQLLHREVVKSLSAQDVREQFAALGAEAVGSTPEVLAVVLKRDLAKWAKVAREANVKAE
jgi:tripartite-type tricarboxylate transporter receptor subunit TctC